MTDHEWADFDRCVFCGAPLAPGSGLAGDPARWFCSPEHQRAWVEANHPEWLKVPNLPQEQP